MPKCLTSASWVATSWPGTFVSALHAYTTAPNAGVIRNGELSRTVLDFESQSETDQEWMVRETWCDQCKKPDLGIGNPILYIEDGRKYIEGNYLVCDALCISEITATIINE